KKPFGYGVWVPGGGSGEYTQATFYIWNAAGNQTGTGTTNTRSYSPKRYAPIGQGFMLVGNNAGIVKIKNSHRTYVKENAAGGFIFFRPTSSVDDVANDDPTGNQMSLSAQSATEVDTRTPQLRLYTIFDDALTRDMLLLFSPEATD